MLDFMIIGLPRSATTWASNLFTTDHVHCHHDPLYTKHYEQWDSDLPVPERLTGVSCTGIWRWPDWLNQHPARKVLLHRDLDQVNDELHRLGMPQLGPEAEEQLWKVIGLHVPFGHLFEPDGAKAIWDYLTHGKIPFNERRWLTLVGIEMQPYFDGVRIDPGVTRKLFEELTRIMENS